MNNHTQGGTPPRTSEREAYLASPLCRVTSKLHGSCRARITLADTNTKSTRFGGHACQLWASNLTWKPSTCLLSAHRFTTRENHRSHLVGVQDLKACPPFQHISASRLSFSTLAYRTARVLATINAHCYTSLKSYERIPNAQMDYQGPFMTLQISLCWLKSCWRACLWPARYGPTGVL